MSDNAVTIEAATDKALDDSLEPEFIDDLEDEEEFIEDVEELDLEDEDDD
jgi:hypothetical protein